MLQPNPNDICCDWTNETWGVRLWKCVMFLCGAELISVEEATEINSRMIPWLKTSTDIQEWPEGHLEKMLLSPKKLMDKMKEKNNE